MHYKSDIIKFVVIRKATNYSGSWNVCCIREFGNNYFMFYLLLRHIPLPEFNEKPTLDNIDSYMLKLQSLMTNATEEHQQLIKEVKTIMRQLQNSLANGTTPVVAVKSNNVLLSTPNSTPFISTTIIHCSL